jgi:hypothetical protein
MRKVTKDNIYNGHRLYNASKNNQGFYAEILNAIEMRFNYMIEAHSKVLFTRFDLRYPSGSTYKNDNELVSRFAEALRLYCKRKEYDPQYLWVRELSENNQVHYHFMLLMNGNKIQNPYKLIHDYVLNLWKGCLGIQYGEGLVHYVYSNQSSGMILRNHPNLKQTIDAYYQHASYLAKVYSKGNMPAFVNGYGCSRIPSSLH